MPLTIKRYPIGFFHIDIAEVQSAEGKLYLFVGIDRTSKFAVTQIVDKADRKTAWEFLQRMLEAVSYQVHTILTDRAIGTPLVRVTTARGIQFAEQPRNRNTIYSRPMRFDMICEANGIEHCLTQPNHPWTNGQVERMNRTIKDATVKRFHHDSHNQLRPPPGGLRGGLQFCTQACDPGRFCALRLHLQDLDIRARQIHPESDPPRAGAEQPAPENC